MRTLGLSTFLILSTALFATPRVAPAQGVAPGLRVTVQSVSIPGDLRPEVLFTATDDLGVPVLLEELTDVRFILGVLEASPGATTKRYVSYTTRIEDPDGVPGSGDEAVQADYDSARLRGVTRNADGTFTYKFAGSVPGGFAPSATHQIAGQLRRTFAVDGESYRANVALAFRPDGQPVQETRDVVQTESCNACHTRLSVHGDVRREVQLCIMCHNSQTVDANTGNPVDFPQMIHKIHRGKDLPSFVRDGIPYEIVGFRDTVHDFSEVVFPQDIRNCNACHKSDFYLANPSQAGCGSCHDRVWFGDPVAMPAGFETHPIPNVTDGECRNCHQPGVLDIASSHRTEEEVFGPGLALEILEVRTAAASSDADRDGIPDETDNCVEAANPDQADADTDGIGDACECGDASGDGRVTSTDARLIQRCAAGEIPCAALCDASGDDACDTTDARLVQRLAVGQLTKNDLSCAERPTDALAPATALQVALTIRFSATDRNGDPIAVLDASTMNILAATVAWPVPEYEVAVRESLFSSFGQPADGTLVNEGGGLYAYTFRETLPADSRETFAVAMEGRRPYSPDGGVTTLEQGTATNAFTRFTLDGSPPAARRAVVDEARCQACHREVRMHGELRVGVDYCVMCHNPNATDEERRPADQLPPETVHFKVLVHRIHTGHDLTSPYTVFGFGGVAHDFTEVHFPGQRQECSICHSGESNELPLPDEALSTRVTQSDPGGGTVLVSDTLPTRATCTGCHDDPFTDVHALLNTDVGREAESCSVCHGPGKAFAVDQVHELGP